jgi:hypothetical protein
MLRRSQLYSAIRPRCLAIIAGSLAMSRRRSSASNRASVGAVVRVELPELSATASMPTV